MRRAMFVAAVAAGLASSSGCGGSADGKVQIDIRHTRERGGTPVATFDHDSITAQELERRINEMSPVARARYQTLEQKKEYVEGLARFELLAEEAARQGLANDPDVVETTKKVLVQKLMQRQFDDRAVKVTDADLADYYQKHLSDYQRPELVRLGHILLAAPDAAAKAKRRSEAQALHDEIAKQDPNDYSAFAFAARTHDEDKKTQPIEGDLRFLSRDEIENQVGPEVAKAVDALKKNGELAPLVETARGFEIVKLLGRQSALNLSFDQVRQQLSARILYERREEAYERFIAELKSRAHYRIDDEALAKVPVDLKAPTQQPSGPVPGFVPPPSPTR